jgi:hypothetical protein
MEACHRLFGLTVTSGFPFNIALPPGHGPAELSLSLSAHPFGHPLSPPLYVSAFRDRNGASLASLYREAPGELLCFPKAGDFRVGSNRIDGYWPRVQSDLAELRLLGPVMSYWFERNGFTVLHASAVVVDRLAIAFVSSHGGGKSGLAAAMIQAGASLLTDDLLVLEERHDQWEGRPSYPHMRMWPDEAEYFLGSYVDLPSVQKDAEKRSVAIGEGGFGSFLEASAPLDCVYLASRRPETGGGIEIQPVSRSEALIELVRHSFSARLVEAAGLQPARLDRLARLVRAVPVRRLVYPSGFDRLPEVVKSLHNLDANLL